MISDYQTSESRLKSGETIRKICLSNALAPTLVLAQEYVVEPVDILSVEKGDIVFAKVRGKTATLRVFQLGYQGVLLGTSTSSPKTWTKEVYGRVCEIRR